ncbi:hypothetical protein J2T20_003245 [Paenibacillus wynnii]|nr:hypothetical protein [Paenibacillus wynnii]
MVEGTETVEGDTIKVCKFCKEKEAKKAKRYL